MEFGEWLKQKRLALDMTQAAFAEAVSCSIETVRKIEAGRRRPSRQFAEILADYFSVPAGERTTFLQRARGLQEGADPARRTWESAEPPPQTPESNAATVPAPPEQATAATATNATTSERSPGPLAPTSIYPSPLPYAPTALVGRESELVQIRSLLWRASARLVTLVGPPGIGKTRLAQAVASTLRDDFNDGVVYVPLVGVTDPALVASTLARALGLSEGQDSPLEAMQKALYSRQMLIVLDNFEQVVEAAPVVADLLAAAPQIKILVTSRSSLHLRGEKLVNIPPLALPDLNHLPPLEELGHVESVALFVGRAQDAVGNFDLTPANAALVAQICAQLDGLPLAIELAAARTRLLSLSALHAKLERQPGQENQPGQLGLLKGGPRDAPADHQALRRAIESSYSLLDVDEQKLFRRLGIFVGAFTFEAADAVAGATLESLETVLDQSLVRRQPPSNGNLEEGMRFSLLASIREYAQEALVAHSELQEMSLKHARYLLDLIHSTKDQATGPNEQRWVATSNAWLSDFRSAMRWAIKAGDAEIALSIASELHTFWRLGHMAEGGRWLEEALAVSSNAPDGVRAQGLQVASSIAQVQSNYAKSRFYAQQSLPLYQELQDRYGMALAFSALGVAAAEEGDYKQALTLFEQSLDSWRDLGNNYNAATLLFNMSFMSIRMKDYDRAVELAKESEAAFHTSGNAAGAARAKITLGLALLHKGDYDQSMKMHTECLALLTELENMRGVSLAHTYLGLALLAQGDFNAATPHFREGLMISQETSNKTGAQRAILGLAGVASSSGHAQRAVRLVSALIACGFDATENTTPAERELQERIIAKAHETLTEIEFAAAWTVGQWMSLEEAEQFALQTT